MHRRHTHTHTRARSKEPRTGVIATSERDNNINGWQSVWCIRSFGWSDTRSVCARVGARWGPRRVDIVVRWRYSGARWASVTTELGNGCSYCIECSRKVNRFVRIYEFSLFSLSVSHKGMPNCQRSVAGLCLQVYFIVYKLHSAHGMYRRMSERIRGHKMWKPASNIEVHVKREYLFSPNSRFVRSLFLVSFIEFYWVLLIVFPNTHTLSHSIIVGQSNAVWIVRRARCSVDRTEYWNIFEWVFHGKWKELPDSSLHKAMESISIAVAMNQMSFQRRMRNRVWKRRDVCLRDMEWHVRDFRFRRPKNYISTNSNVEAHKHITVHHQTARLRCFVCFRVLSECAGIR